MTSLKPYLIRSVYEWLLDNGLTPYLEVNTSFNKGNLPEDYIQDGKIVLNIKPQAIEALSLGNEMIEFNARFKGKPMTVVISVNAVARIYAKESGEGLAFVPEPPKNEDLVASEQKPSAKPTLRVIK